MVYLCGTKYDLVEENKKSRKVEAGVVTDYLDGKLEPLVLHLTVYVSLTTIRP